MGPLLQITDVSKAYSAEVQAVRGVSLAVDEHDILCLLGPSGCGKTTLLRIVAGLEVPDAGEIRFAGQDIAPVRPHERSFGMMFQDFALFPHLSVHDNVAFGLKMHRLPAAEIETRVREMLALVALDGKEARGISELSGGEQQRVALARSLAPRPRLLLLDEPLGALDRALRERLMLDVREILKRVGVTALYVTHDQTEAYAVADRLAVMNAGRIEQIDTPQQVYRAPATPFVANFLGFRNLVSAEVDAVGAVRSAVGYFEMSKPSEVRGRVTLLIRPSVLAVERAVPGGEGGGANVIEGVATAGYFRGRYRQLWIDAGGEALLFETEPDLVFEPGERVRVRIDPASLLLY